MLRAGAQKGTDGMHDPDRAKTTVLDGEPRQTWNGCSHV